MQAPPSHVLPAVQQEAWRGLWDWLLAPDEPAEAQKQTPAPTDLAAGGTGADQGAPDHGTAYTN